MAIGLYLHVPFRRTDRRHDDAYAIPYDANDVATYVDAVCTEIEMCADRIQSEAVRTLYVGGGRPSVLVPDAFGAILDTLRRHLSFDACDEATIERHPLDATPPVVDFICNNGLTRASLDLLSWDADVLRTIDAPHTLADAALAVERLQESGLSSFSVDLLFGVPGQSAETWAETLRRTVDRGVPHVTLVEWTDSDAADADRTAAMFRHAHECLREAGYTPYEMTHFARPGHASLHENHLMDSGTLLGLGPSAHSFWWPSPRSETTAQRWHNVSDLHAYADALRRGERPLEGAAIDLPPHALAQEYVDRRLRTAAGLDLGALAHDTGIDLRTTSGDRLSRLVDAGLARMNDDTVRLTVDGHLQLDAIVPFLCPG